MRIFVALDIDECLRQHIQRFLEGIRGFAPEARWVRPQSLHITLKFIGEKQPHMVEQIKHALSLVRVEAMEVSLHGYGFFPSPKAARVFWVGIQAGPQLAKLAGDIDDAMAPLGIEKEDHAFSPHLTLARLGGSGWPRRQKSDWPNARFNRIQEKLAALPEPDFGTMAIREFFLYQSKLSPGGPQYTKLARFAFD